MSENTEQNSISNDDVMRMTADIVASFLGNNTIPSDSVPGIIRDVHRTVQGLAGEAEAPQAKQKPAVPVSKSVTDEHIICLEDGKKLKMLKRYLRTNFDMTPDEYRRKWNLPADYPMVAPAYAKKRSEYAKKIGLGRGGKKR
jgi:predicted transcriptional regulator